MLSLANTQSGAGKLLTLTGGVPETGSSSRALLGRGRGTTSRKERLAEMCLLAHELDRATHHFCPCAVMRNTGGLGQGLGQRHARRTGLPVGNAGRGANSSGVELPSAHLT